MFGGAIGEDIIDRTRRRAPSAYVPGSDLRLRPYGLCSLDAPAGCVHAHRRARGQDAGAGPLRVRLPQRAGRRQLVVHELSRHSGLGHEPARGRRRHPRRLRDPEQQVVSAQDGTTPEHLVRVAHRKLQRRRRTSACRAWTPTPATAASRPGTVAAWGESSGQRSWLPGLLRHPDLLVDHRRRVRDGPRLPRLQAVLAAWSAATTVSKNETSPTQRWPAVATVLRHVSALERRRRRTPGITHGNYLIHQVRAGAVRRLRRASGCDRQRRWPVRPRRCSRRTRCAKSRWPLGVSGRISDARGPPRR